MRLEHLLSREKKVCTIGFYRRLEPFNFVLYYIDTVSLSIGKIGWLERTASLVAQVVRALH